ncbi:hypothetical protein EJ08DRAFT_28454 [Tothia fuscella]|uniref:Uncharacterized protein n=1 Tax=Tothia fuscella TaxID=1048955 RepID=A0A9P4NGH8_9PEZI|nr:hypothetical protein EJ08DRAFT_28454 [Tothia fuscella]
MNGTYASSSIHMAGLKIMVELRGRLHNFGHSQMLQRILTWTDFAYCTTWNEKPIFPLLPHLSGTSAQFPSHLLSPLPKILQMGLLYLPHIQPRVFEILHSLHQISSAITWSLNQKEAATQLERKQISMAVYTTEYALLLLRSSEEDTAITELVHNVFNLSNVLLLAAHLYLHLAIRELPGTAKMHLNMLNQLYRAIPDNLSVAVLLWDNSSLEVVIWVLFIGAAAADGHACRKFFVQKLREVIVVLEVLNRVEFEETLRGVLWLNRFCKTHCFQVWAEMGI